MYRPHYPTAHLTEIEVRAFYKANQVRHDCAFALRPGTSTPADLRAAWEALRGHVDGRTEKSADRAIAASLRDCWRRWQAGQAYTAPVLPEPVVKPRRRAQPCACPHCGKALAA